MYPTQSIGEPILIADKLEPDPSLVLAVGLATDSDEAIRFMERSSLENLRSQREKQREEQCKGEVV